jgi:hypothetical protein
MEKGTGLLIIKFFKFFPFFSHVHLIFNDKLNLL